ncbi:MAG TPA: hypothetical protein VFW64_15630 [Pseudonocardiaceae bacterium]|nr:hypothetical protein [Pseudonocardiaceae bacterium]
MALTWVPLVAALLGGLFTLGSVALTQRSATKRERERLEATWAREDANRSYEHRRAAYVDFIKEVNQQWRDFAEMELEGDHYWEPTDDYRERSYNCLVQIEIFGTKEAAKLAEEALRILYNTLPAGEQQGQHHILDHQDLLEPLKSEIRRNLSIPDRPA